MNRGDEIIIITISFFSLKGINKQLIRDPLTRIQNYTPDRKQTKKHKNVTIKQNHFHSYGSNTSNKYAHKHKPTESASSTHSETDTLTLTHTNTDTVQENYITINDKNNEIRKGK